MERTPVVIVGGGPIGIACAAECARRGLLATIVERGCLLESLARYPTHMRFFSTASRLEIAGVPFPCVRAKPTRDEALEYYRNVARRFELDTRLYTTVAAVAPAGDGGFLVTTDRGVLACERVVLATGFFDHPVALGVPGEGLPKVSHYFVDGHRYYDQDLAIVGAANSAVIAALECWRRGARVTMLVRGEDFYEGVKYWLLPDIRNRIGEGEIAAHFATEVEAVHPNRLSLRTGDRRWELGNDFVLAMTGYRADDAWLRALGIELDDRLRPVVDERFESRSRPGIHVAGCALCGVETGSVFIENGREHAAVIAEHFRDIGVGGQG